MSASAQDDFTKLSLAEAEDDSERTELRLELDGKAHEMPGSATLTYEEVDENTCAICLNKPALTDSAQPESCEHLYCACCILHWTVYKEKPWCPQCKAPFSSLLTYRTLDGELRDYPARESVCLLKRARWFQEHVQARERAIAEASAPRPSSGGFLQGSVIDESDYVDYERYYDEYDDDEEVENYYFSAAAGRARVVIGNRRHGPNGFISSGRLQARPNPAPQQAGKAKKHQADQGASSSGRASGRSPAGEAASKKQQHTPQQQRSQGKQRDTAADESPSGGSGKQSAGRRARRHQRRAAADARAGF